MRECGCVGMGLCSVADQAVLQAVVRMFSWAFGGGQALGGRDVCGNE